MLKSHQTLTAICWSTIRSVEYSRALILDEFVASVANDEIEDERQLEIHLSGFERPLKQRVVKTLISFKFLIVVASDAFIFDSWYIP